MGRSPRPGALRARAPMTANTVVVRLNGEPARVAFGTTVAEVVATLTTDPRGCAVARNGEVVRRSDWEREVLVEGDHLEVLAPAAGG
jgi:sulfur carrier protein